MIEVRDSNFQIGGEESSFPFVSIGIAAILFIISIGTWFLARNQNRELKAVYNQLICYYLEKDYTRPSPEIIKIFPKKLKKYAKKATEVVEKFYRDPYVRDRAQEWLSQGSGVWDKIDSSKVKAGNNGENCLEVAIAKGKFSGNLERRIWTTMALTDPIKLREDEENLRRLERKYLSLRESHPHYGWGLFDGFSPLKLLSSIFINRNPLSAVFPIIFLALLGIFIEYYWGFLTLLIPFFLGGILGNTALFFLNSNSHLPVLGSEGAILAVTGFFIAASWKRKLRLSIRPVKKELPLHPLILGGLALISAALPLFLSYGPIAALAGSALTLAAGAGVWFGLVAAGQLQPLPEPISQTAKSGERRNPLLKQPPIKTAEKPASTLKVRGLSIKNRPALVKADSRTLAEEAYKKGDYANAITLYRELYLKGEASLEDFKKLFDACKKSGQNPSLEDYLRALRTASFEGQTDEVLSYYKKIRELPLYKNLQGRERISIARALEKVNLFEEALAELEEQLKEGPDSSFYIDALLAKAHLLLNRKTEEDLEELVKVIYRAELFAEKYPQYKGLIDKVKRQVEKIEEEENLPLASSLPIPAENKGDGEQQEEREVDEKFLEELEKMMNLDPSKVEDDEAGESWAELPLLMLKRENSQNNTAEKSTEKNDTASDKEPDQLLSLPDDPFLSVENDPFLSVEEEELKKTTPAEAESSHPPRASELDDLFGADSSPLASDDLFGDLQLEPSAGEENPPSSQSPPASPNDTLMEPLQSFQEPPSNPGPAPEKDPSRSTIVDPQLAEEIKKIQTQVGGEPIKIGPQENSSPSPNSTLVEMPKIQNLIQEQAEQPKAVEVLPVLELTEVVESDDEDEKK